MVPKWISALVVLIILLYAHDLHYATYWNMLAMLSYLCLPPEIANEICLTQFVFAQTWALAIGISVIIGMNSTIMDDACQQYGCGFAWTGNIIIHYLAPVTITARIYSVPFNQHLLHPPRLIVGWTCTLVTSVLYGVYMDPVSRYKLEICIHTFLAWLSLSAAVALVALRYAVAPSVPALSQAPDSSLPNR